MKHFDQFVIEDYSFDALTGVACFTYSFDHEYFFHEKIDFSLLGKSMIDYDKTFLDHLLFHLSLALGVSYYKSFPTQTIVVSSGYLDESAGNFWSDFYLLGLGEFFYRNDLAPVRPSFIVSARESEVQLQPYDAPDSAPFLLPRGGGKDSLVSASLLATAGHNFDVRTFGRNYSVHSETAAVINRTHCLTKRAIAPELSPLLAKGYYNGHVPITGVIHFVSHVVAYLYGYRGVVFSNEGSANIGNIEWKGLSVNHQWSKSFAFESSFAEYKETFLFSSLPCFSLLRPWSELRVAKEFARSPSFFASFSSCNRNFHLDARAHSRRCCICPKCAFVYMIVRPFVSEADVQQIRGKELYHDSSLFPLFSELWGLTGLKPFECVGSFEEVQYATWLTLHKGLVTSPVLDFFRENLALLRSDDEWRALGSSLNSFSGEHLIPQDLISSFFSLPVSLSG